MEKYYDFIVELVKSHRKYSEYASILDDIVDDVCAQAKTIIGSIDNDEVVKSYLGKIVSTSMITVPKRLGVIKSRQTIIIPEKTDVSDEDSVNDALFEENFTDDGDVQNETDLTPEETYSDDVAELNIEGPEGYSNNDETVFTGNEGPNFVDNESEITDNITVDKNLVDRMINGVAAEEAGIVAPEGITDATESVSEPELSFDTADENIQLIENTETEENIDAKPEVYAEIPETDSAEEVPQDNSIDTTENSETTSVLLDTLYPVEDLAETEINIDEPADISDELVSFETESLSLEADESIEMPDMTLMEQPLSDIENNSESVHQDATGALEESGDFVPPSYKLFGFIPEETSNDTDEIMSDVKAIDAKNPGKHILDICNAKYKDGKSVGEISEELNISADSVIEVLNEIIYIVKD